jgi:hypothetical protein
MADLGIEPHAIEACLNHVVGTRSAIARVYNKSTYEREKRRGLELWANHLMGMVEGQSGNVVKLQRA